MQLLLAALVFIIVILVMAAIYVLLSGPKHGEIVRGRLEAIEKGAAHATEALSLNLLRDELMSSIPAFNKMLVRWSSPGRLRNFISQAGMEVKPGKFVLMSAAIGVATLEVIEVIYGNFWGALVRGVRRYVSADDLYHHQAGATLGVPERLSRGHRTPGPLGARRTRLYFRAGDRFHRPGRPPFHRVSGSYLTSSDWVALAGRAPGPL